MERKVVITGMGVITSNGTGKAEFWDGLVAGRSGIAPIRSFDTTGYEVHIGGEIPSFVTRPGGGDRSFQLLDVALNEALAELPAGLLDDPAERAATGISLGTSQGAVLTAEPLHRTFKTPDHAGTEDERARFKVYPFGAGAHQVASRMGLGGPRTTISMACVSSAMTVLHSMDLIRRGHAKRMLAGGFEAFSQFIFTGFHSLQALDPKACRPFDADREGTVLGEGAAIVVLEEKEAALARGAHIYAEVVGGGYAGDAVHLTAPDRTGSGLARAIRAAMAQGGITDPTEIGYVNAHGTGTIYNDGMEIAAFAQIFGDHVVNVPISSLKPFFGHCLGAVGAIEVVASVLALQNEFVPPTLNHRTNPRECPGWDFIPEQGKKVPGLHTVLSTNAAFGGNNSALLLRHPSRTSAH